MARSTVKQRSQGAGVHTRPAARTGARRPSRRTLLLGAIAVLAVVAIGGLAVGRSGGGSGDALSTLHTADFHALAFSPSAPDQVFYGHHNGVMRSDDGGRTWTHLVDRTNFDAMNMAVSTADPQRVYLAGHDIFEVSSDGGKSWQRLATNLPGLDVHGFAMSPDDPTRLYAFVVGFGGFASTDGGRTWQKLAGRLPGDVMSLVAAGGSPETLYAGSMQSGILRSQDGGQSWQPVSAGLGRMVYSIAGDPGAPQTLYAGVDGGLFKSTNGGANWSKLPLPGGAAAVIGVSRARPDRVLAIVLKGDTGLVYRSDDGGQTWTGRQ